MDQKDELLNDIKNLAKLTEEEDFEVAKNLTIKKWKTFAPNFCKYFEKEYLYNWKKNLGFSHSIPGLTRSNGNSEGFNHWYKGKFMDYHRLPLHEFIP